MSMKRITLLPILLSLCGVFCLGSLYSQATAIPSEKVTTAEASAFPAPQKLFEENDKGGNNSLAIYDFGVGDLMDPSLAAENPEESQPVDGIKHIFVLENRSDKPITITAGRINEPCTSVKVFQYVEILKQVYPDDFPYTVPPHKKAKVLVGLDPFIVFPGRVWASIDLLGENQKEPLITLVMKGILNNGIKFSSQKMDFGRISAGSMASRTLNLSIDRRVQSNIPGASMILSSKM
jgi:hypothetical protein